MSSPNISATSGRTMNARKGTEQPVRRTPRGAEKVTVPFPDAWDSYEYTKLAEGQSPNSVRTPQKRRAHHTGGVDSRGYGRMGPMLTGCDGTQGRNESEG